MNSQTPTYDVARWFTIPPIALLVTLLLLLLMHLLIYVEVPEIPSIKKTEIPNVIMEKTPPIEIVDIKPIKVDDPQVPPSVPENPPDFGSNTGEGVSLIPYTPPATPGPEINLGGQLVAHFKVQPNYPIRASSRGIEGYVVVEFDVTESGATDNVRIVTAEPENIFEKSVIQAVQRWRYNPKEVNGVPVRTYSQRERISFSLNR